MHESEQRLRLLVESTSQAVWETDAQGNVVTDSPSWRAYTGQPLTEGLSRGWLDVVHPEDRSSAQQQWHGCLVRGAA